MLDTISFERLLEVTAEDLAIIRDNLGAVYMNETIDSETKNVALATAFNTIDSWSSYFNKFKEIQESKLDELNRANASLINENKKLASENSKLKEDLAMINEKMNNANYKIGTLQATLEASNNNSNLVSVDLVEMIEKLETIADSYESAIKAAEHKAAMKTFNKRVASGDVKPAKRADISDEYIIENVKNGISAYKIAQNVGMTQQAILYRIKRLKETGLI